MDVRKMMNQEIREKKRTASGVHGKTGKRGYVGKMMFPNDIMSAKEKRQYRKASKVKVTNMYETMISYEEFLKLSKQDQYNTLKAYRENFGVTTVYKTWKIGANTFYKLVADLDLPPMARGNKGGKRKGAGRPKATTNKTVGDEKAMSVQAETLDIEAIVKEHIEKHLPKKEEKNPLAGFAFAAHIDGEFHADELMNRLMKIASFVEGEDKNYKVTLTITEQGV
ncbi:MULTISPECIES: hypothetical protein [Bacillus cereus group]|uniref:hypothetical protein n=1 Tax=Bacillus cereus group TaxID=86661 RepID=UPI0011A161AA|nr:MULTISPECIES: hypothetical protein [Bacillus cereus group]MDF9638827.1 hypothetical protein [Bacillus cereus]